MSANRHTVTAEEIAMFCELARRGFTRREICEHTGRSERTLSRYVPASAYGPRPEARDRLREARLLNLAKASTALAVTRQAHSLERLAEEARDAAHRKHLAAIARAHGCGFPVVKPDLLAKLAKLERANPRTEFWRGHGVAA